MGWKILFYFQGNRSQVQGSTFRVKDKEAIKYITEVLIKKAHFPKLLAIWPKTLD
jgi:hypothetical protein